MLPVPVAQMRQAISCQAALTAKIYHGFEPCIMHRFAFSSSVLLPTVRVPKLHLWQV